MVMRKFYIIIIALLSFFTITIVKADTLPAFNLRVTENENFDLQMFNDRTYLELFNEVIAYDSVYYDIIINPVVLNSDSTSYRIQLGLIPKGLPFPLSPLNYSQSGNEFFLGYSFPISSYKYYSISPATSLSINNSTDYTNFKNCYLNGVCTGYNQYDIGSSFYRGRNYNVNNSYDNELAQRGYVIYSSLPIPITYSSNFSAKFSSFSVNGTLIEDNDYIPTYYDIIYGEPEPPDPDYHIRLELDNITNILVGNITDLYNFRLNTRFFYDNYDYIYDMSATFRIYGRKSNLDSNDNFLYYSYEDITSSCSAINGHKLDKVIDTSTKYAQFFYFSQGISCGNLDLTQYDNFYLDIQTFATSGNYLISYLEYSSTNGNVYFPKTSAYSIYDTFTNLPSDFSLLVTTNYSQRQVNVVSDNKYVLGCVVNLYNLSSNGACPTPSTIGSLSNLGYMIYKYPEDTSNSVDLSILTSFDSIISYGSNGTGSSSSYTYYDNTGTITNSVINNTITLNYNTNKYDVSSYFDIVNNYINDLSTDINEFSSLVQSFYDSAPNFMQVTIYAIFILL